MSGVESTSLELNNHGEHVAGNALTEQRDLVSPGGGCFRSKKNPLEASQTQTEIMGASSRALTDVASSRIRTLKASQVLDGNQSVNQVSKHRLKVAWTTAVDRAVGAGGLLALKRLSETCASPASEPSAPNWNGKMSLLRELYP
jgi:hypothetical protein